jgi:hypothetical protein
LAPTVVGMRLERLAWITTAWSALFAVVHAYWAAGGSAGMNGEPATTAGEQGYIAFIALLGAVAALVAHRFLRAGPPPRRLTLVARTGGVVLLLGVALGVGRWLADGGLQGDGAAGVVITTYFLIGGLLFSMLGRPGDGAPPAGSGASRWATADSSE